MDVATQIIANALGRFANAMRLYGEAFYRYRGLVEVDKEEAIHNLDRSFEATLEGFHGLYDVSKPLLDYHAFPETSLLISLRNALHHRDHPLFHSLLQNLWLDGEPERRYGAEYLIARHRTTGGEPPPMMHLIKLSDISDRLDPRADSPYLNRMGKSNALAQFQRLETGLALTKIWSKARGERYPDKQVYIDILPIFNSAVSRVFIALVDAGVPFRNYDENAYKKMFIEEVRSDLQHFDFFALRINDAQLAFGPKLTVQMAARPSGNTYQTAPKEE
ncbi:hypothetical protein [Pseudomonas taiwanensis]|uniref:Uncharacterized protein n=1 Tax=Pseudomonas taiwanensis TaxID=470150 RepID=A0ABR6V844_9PSED|nr:hypothetical protein [Pseudomonas taiwanensis]MBC3476559.1 hypothetical protein [Pseudomonas taiwanensis]MBC3490680.1 hypothetical protein [Pseudomonas taiwanensis]